MSIPGGVITHADHTYVMDTLCVPADPHYRFYPGQYVYVHSHAAEHNDFDAVESVIEDVSGAPFEIVVTPCNHPELTHTVSQDKLSAPIQV